MATNIRKATKDDAAQIAETLNTEQVVAWIDRQGDNGAMFVVADGRQVFGFGALDFDSAEPVECSFGAWQRARNRRQRHGATLAEEVLAFARERGYKRIRARLPENNEPALSDLSSIGAMVPMRNSGTTFELPVYQEHE